MMRSFSIVSKLVDISSDDISFENSSNDLSHSNIFSSITVDCTKCFCRHSMHYIVGYSGVYPQDQYCAQNCRGFPNEVVQ